ncbi:MAG: hypothetical protein V3U72_00940 [Candidatus Aenigmarchaeota archaeon]
MPEGPKKLSHVQDSVDVIFVHVIPGFSVAPGQAVITAVYEAPPSASTLMSQLSIGPILHHS